jgi:hypothetical protein
MPKARELAEKLVPAGGDAGGRKEIVDAVAEDLRTAAGDPPALGFLQRIVEVPCPSGKHQRSMLTFRSHTVAAMFCIPCEKGWTEPTTHPALRDFATDSPR